MRLEVGRFLPEIIKDLSPKDRAFAAAGVVKMLQGTGRLLVQSGAGQDALIAFKLDAEEANKIARQTIQEEGFDPEYAHQVDFEKILESTT